MPRSFFGRSELELLAITIVFQIVSLFTILRVVLVYAPPPVSNTTSIATTTTVPPVIYLPTKPTQSIAIPTATPQFVSPTGSSVDAGFILALIFVAANVVVIGFLAYLYRRKKMKWFSLLISLFLAFNVTELYFTFLSGLTSYIPVIASFAALGVTLIAAYKGSPIATNIMALVVALELGSSFPVLLQSPLNWIIPAVYAVFDIYAVYYGRLGKLVREVSAGEEVVAKPSAPVVPIRPTPSPPPTEQKQSWISKWPDFGLLSVRLSSIEIGMADIAFYTMVPAVALILNSTIAFFVVMAAVDAGILFSFTLFRKSEVSPGLPVPILLGLGALLVSVLVIR